MIRSDHHESYICAYLRMAQMAQMAQSPEPPGLTGPPVKMAQGDGDVKTPGPPVIT
jgi:hypothetical protein